MIIAAQRIASKSAALRYRAYGLIIESDIALSGLEAETGPGAADMVISLHDESCPLEDLVDAEPGGPPRHHFGWDGVGAFLLIGSRQIIVAPVSGAADQLLSLPLLGPVMAVSLHLRGLLVLHASALDIGGAAAVFIGDKGAGKSTTAAALLRRGHNLLSDDVVALGGETASAPLVLPAYPQIKLVADAAEGLILPGSQTLPPPVKDFPKEQRRLEGQFTRTSLPPRRIYQLVAGETTRIHECGAGEALAVLMRFAYVAMVTRYPWSPQERRAHMERCSALASAARVRRLEVKRDLARIDDVVRLVEEDTSSA